MRKIWRTKYEQKNHTSAWLKTFYISILQNGISTSTCYAGTRVSSRHWRGNKSEQMLHAWFPGSRPNLFQWSGMSVDIGFWCIFDEYFVLLCYCRLFFPLFASCSQCDHPEKQSLAPFWTMSKSALALFQVSSNPSLYMHHGWWVVMDDHGSSHLGSNLTFNVSHSCRNANSQEPGHWASLQSSTILMKPSHGLARDWNGHCQSKNTWTSELRRWSQGNLVNQDVSKSLDQKFITGLAPLAVDQAELLASHTKPIRSMSHKCLWSSGLRPSVGSCFMMSGESKIGCKYIHALDGSTTTLI